MHKPCLLEYSQHTQAEDARHGVTVAHQVAAVPAVLRQPPLPLLFADGSVVDGQGLHHKLRSRSRSLFFFSFFTLCCPNSPLSLCLSVSSSASSLFRRRPLGCRHRCGPGAQARPQRSLSSDVCFCPREPELSPTFPPRFLPTDRSLSNL